VGSPYGRIPFFDKVCMLVIQLRSYFMFFHNTSIIIGVAAVGIIHFDFCRYTSLLMISRGLNL
jgi:hypothetical protein